MPWSKPSGGKRWERSFRAQRRRIARNPQQGSAQPPRRCSPGHGLIEFIDRFRLSKGIARNSLFIEKDDSGVLLPAPLPGPQNPGLHRLGILCIQLSGNDESHLTVRIGLEHAVDGADMRMGMQVERRAEAMDEGGRAGACIRPRTHAVRTQMTRDLVAQDASGGIEGLAVMLQLVT